MADTFADTFYFIALLNPADEGHVRARTITSALRSPLVTTVWVLAEVANTLRRRETRRLFLTLLAALRSDSTATIVGPDQRWLDAGLELYSARLDKDWSLTDCISFAIMKDRGISEALTGDHHFEQAGFKALLS
jgi:predicted nucleic acid-binding protein